VDRGVDERRERGVRAGYRRSYIHSIVSRMRLMQGRMV
jgi:hypothetical protein